MKDKLKCPDWCYNWDRVRIRPKWLYNCTPKECQQLNRLRFKGDSLMYEDVIMLPMNYHRKLVRVFLARHGPRIVGWSCALLPPPGDYTYSRQYVVPFEAKHTPIYTYVSRRYQGSGLGKRLLKRAANYVVSQKLKPTVFFYDEGSSAFFVTVSKDVPELEVFDIAEWFDVYE